MQVAEQSDHSDQSPGKQSAFLGQSQVGAVVLVVVVNEAAAHVHRGTPTSDTPKLWRSNAKQDQRAMLRMAHSMLIVPILWATVPRTGLTWAKHQRSVDYALVVTAFVDSPVEIDII